LRAHDGTNEGPRFLPKGRHLWQSACRNRAGRAPEAT
jgi:hypothetical protein